MTDRELLMLAAKAVGLSHGEWLMWRPLEDDGDALRLAVKLQMQVTVYTVCTDASAYGKDKVREMDGFDDLAMTRRAIVRAAAEVGKAMP